MKRVLALFGCSILGFSLIALDAYASSAGGSSECGLGWYVTQRKSLFATSIRATTNETVPPTFGMTSGTSNCDMHSIVEKEMDAVTFAVANYDALSIDMAKGTGETLEGFTTTLGCRGNADLARALRSNYSRVLNTAPIAQPEATPANSGLEMYENVRQLIRSDRALAASCPNAA